LGLKSVSLLASSPPSQPASQTASRTPGFQDCNLPIGATVWALSPLALWPASLQASQTASRAQGLQDCNLQIGATAWALSPFELWPANLQASQPDSLQDTRLPGLQSSNRGHSGGLSPLALWPKPASRTPGFQDCKLPKGATAWALSPLALWPASLHCNFQ